MTVRYTIKDYTLDHGPDNKKLAKLLQHKDIELQKQECRLRLRGLCPKHRIFLNCLGKCDCCD